MTEFYQDNPSLGYAQLRRSEMERFGEGDARDTAAAMRGMSKKIAGALAGCDNRCTQTDRLIIAGIAQNESWGAEGARALLNNSEFRFDGRAGLDWVKILKTYAPETDWRNGPRAQGVSWIFFVLRQYIFDVLLLADLGWEMPKDVDISYLKCIAAGDQVCKQ